MLIFLSCVSPTEQQNTCDASLLTKAKKALYSQIKAIFMEWIVGNIDQLLQNEKVFPF